MTIGRALNSYLCKVKQLNTMHRDFKGIWIPKEIWLNEKLTLREKCLLVEVDSLSNGKKGCYATNEYLGNFIGISAGSLANLLTDMRKRNLINTVTDALGKRYLSVTNAAKSPSQKSEPPSQKGEVGLHKKVKVGVHKKVNIDIQSNNNDIITNIDKQFREEEDEKKPTQKKSVKNLIEFKDTEFASQDWNVAQSAWMDALGTDPTFHNCDWEFYKRRIEDHILENPDFIKVNWAVTIRKWITREKNMRTIGQTKEPKQYVNFRERDQQKRDEELKQLYYDLVINPQPNDPNALPI